MEDVYPRLYAGDDADYVAVKDKPGWSFVRACKYGPGGHKDTLGYAGRAAPKDKNYYSVRKGNRLALNLIDSDDPAYIPEQAIDAALSFIDERLKAGDKVLVACNQGHSRGPSIVMMYLGMIHDLPSNFREAYRVFKVLYSKFAPAQGMSFFLKKKYSTFEKEQQ